MDSHTLSQLYHLFCISNNHYINFTIHLESILHGDVQLVLNNFQNLFSLLFKFRTIICCLFGKPVPPKILSIWLSALRAVWNLQRSIRLLN